MSDYWTADVFALYGLIPVPGGQTRPPADSEYAEGGIIRLIDRRIALADAESRRGSYANILLDETGGSRRGYVFRAFENEESDGAAFTLRNDTDGQDVYYGACHDRARFAFLAVPESLSEGGLGFRVNGDNQIWQFRLAQTYRLAYQPLSPRRESSSTITGTDDPRFENARLYPQAPGSNGCSDCR